MLHKQNFIFSDINLMWVQTGNDVFLVMDLKTINKKNYSPVFSFFLLKICMYYEVQ